MTRLDHSQALFAFLGLGIANLAALNHWALPGTFTETEVNSATDAQAVSILRPTPVPEPVQPTAAHVNSLPSAAGPEPTPAAAVTAEASPPAAQVATATSASAVVEFQRGTWWIGRRGRNVLRDSLAQLPRGQVVIEIDGHADAAGPRGLNQRISEERAQAVAALLEHSGLTAAQIEVRAFGERKPRKLGSNRRVEIRIRGAQ